MLAEEQQYFTGEGAGEEGSGYLQQYNNEQQQYNGSSTAAEEAEGGYGYGLGMQAEGA